ncbi:hypothetical protein E3T41_17280 [Cryobacterium sp. Hh38]|nr:type IIL restriction-modification enzyme MmeI [Cryobacterium sp. Hh38]TFD55738.1 hypothetical protein E3T41_17280 [Cryobacterium sp. Hh38]
MLADDPRSAPFIKRYMGSAEAINDGERYCLWIPEGSVAAARAISAIESRLVRVASERSKSKAASTVAYAAQPHRFVQISYKPTESILVPSISSERRDYIPIGYVGPETVISNKGFAVYDAQPWVFGLLTSRMHMAWTNAVSGRMEMRYQYSNTIVYNNWPVPPLSNAVKEKLTAAALRVLDVREYHCERTLAQLYDPDLMPSDLRAAHADVDALVDSIYSKRGYETDEQRLSDLFGMYEKMTADEALNGGEKK